MPSLARRCCAWFCDPLCCVFDLRRPCSCPHGKCYTFMSVMMAVASMVSGIMSVRSCFFMQVQLIDERTGHPVTGTMRGYGYFSHEIEPGQTPDYQTCVAYTPAEESTFSDWWWKYGKFSTVLACALGGMGALIICSTCCLAFHLHMFEKLLLWIYLLAAIFQGLGFLGFGTEFCKEYICKVGPGTGMAISAFMMWLTAANTVKSTPEALPPDENKYQYDEDEEEYYSDENSEDMYYYSDGDGGDDEYDDEYDDYDDDEDSDDYEDSDEYESDESSEDSARGKIV